MVKNEINNRVKQKVKKGSRNASSRRWLERQLNDPYVKAAKDKGYRSRAAFKLIEIDAKYKIFKNKNSVLDLGGAPGGWSQISANRILKNKKGKVISLDLQEMEPIEGVLFIKGNILDDVIKDTIERELGNKVDIVLSDMAPSASGHKNTDQMRSILLAEMALDTAIYFLNTEGNFCCKLIRGKGEEELVSKMKKYFKLVKRYKPSSSRKDSAEIFIIGLNFIHQDLA
tara:strand:- start:25281 stop:25964 length:684 start_codon:yes stop_codon:yes gene_type:complete